MQIVNCYRNNNRQNTIKLLNIYFRSANFKVSSLNLIKLIFRLKLNVDYLLLGTG